MLPDPTCPQKADSKLQRLCLYSELEFLQADKIEQLAGDAKYKDKAG